MRCSGGRLHSSRTRGVLFGVVVALVSLATACSGGSKSPLEIVRTAPIRTAGEHSARVVVAITLPGLGTLEQHGVADLEGQRVELTADLTGIGGPQAGSETVRQIGDDLYVRLTTLEQSIGKPWVHMTLADLGRFTGLDIGGLQQGQSGDVTAAVEMLRGVSRDVEELGTAHLRGVATTKYRFAVVLAKAVERAPDARAKRALQDVADMVGVPEVDMTAWIDDGGRLRQLEYALDLSKFTAPNGSGAKLSGQATYRFEYFDFGTPVNVQKPSDAETADLSTLLQREGLPATPVDTSLDRFVVSKSDVPGDLRAFAPLTGELTPQQYYDQFSSTSAEKDVLNAAGLQRVRVATFLDDAALQAFTGGSDQPPPDAHIVSSFVLQLGDEAGARTAFEFERSDSKSQVQNPIEQAAPELGSGAYVLSGVGLLGDAGSRGSIVSWQDGRVVVAIVAVGFDGSEALTLARAVHGRSG